MKDVFDKLREMSGGKLSQKQVDATNKLLNLDEKSVVGRLFKQRSSVVVDTVLKHLARTRRYISCGLSGLSNSCNVYVCCVAVSPCDIGP